MELRHNQFRAACRGCHGGCVHILTVENGKLVKVEPDPDAPLNKGRACVKGVSIIEQMYHPDRVTYPMRRIGPRGSGQWERISWEEALEIIASRLTDLRETYGPECISLFTGTGRHHMFHTQIDETSQRRAEASKRLLFSYNSRTSRCLSV